MKRTTTFDRLTYTLLVKFQPILSPLFSKPKSDFNEDMNCTAQCLPYVSVPRNKLFNIEVRVEHRYKATIATNLEPIL